MFTLVSWAILLAAGAVVTAGCRPVRDLKPLRISAGVHRVWCAVVLIVGCMLRLVCLVSLPGGISAEEALVGVQAKVLWQTGGFLFSGNLTTQFAQWAGESAGPLLAALTAPFVGIFGMNAWTVRLPLALLSCASLVAAYALGKALFGMRGARWMLTAVALAPYYVLMARMTASVNVAISMMLIATALLVWGMKKRMLLYLGMILMALTAYAQDMYFFIAPAAIVVSAVLAFGCGADRKHVLLSALAGMILCVPAVLTLVLNLSGGESYMLLGIIEIPRLEEFDKAICLYDGLEPHVSVFEATIEKLAAVLIGGIFQAVMHENIDHALFAPKGMLALNVVSVPLIVLGLVSLFIRYIDGQREEGFTQLARRILAAMFVITLLFLVLYGSEGGLNKNGTTSVYDYSTLFIYASLLMTAGACELERRSCAASYAMTTLLVVCVAMLGVHIFDGNYQMDANVYFMDFSPAARRAAQLQQDTGMRVNITSSVYPHVQPDAAAEMMYLYGADASMKNLNAEHESYTIIYAKGIEMPEQDEIYLVYNEDIGAWDYGELVYEEYGNFVVLSPAQQ